MSRIAALTCALFLVLVGAASADTASVGIQAASFGPQDVSVLTGATVSWQNRSLQNHTVTSRTGLFDSARIDPNRNYSRAFPSAGSFPYYCRVHPFMTGEVDVYDVLLNGPARPVTRGEQVKLDGRAAAGVSSVEIQADTGSGFANVDTAAVDGTGSFEASLPATVNARYRAVAGSSTSPVVQVVVVDRTMRVHASRLHKRHGQRHRFDLVRVRVSPPDPGAFVVLQLDLRERFGWWPSQRHKLRASSGTTFRVRAGQRARAVLTLPDGWTPVITSAAKRLPR